MSELFPPFAPDPEPRKRLFRPIPFRVIAPNLITLLGLSLGLTAIRLAFEGRLEPAVLAILAAGVLDGVDGRVARLLKGTSRFGAELDSLSDFVCFGVAPALILYSFTLSNLRGVGWIAALVFAIAGGLRLARFNVMIDDPTRPEWTKNFFVGMSAPAAAVCALLPIYLHFLGVPMGPAMAPVVLIYVLGLAFMMVSTIPTFSGKTMSTRVPRHWVLPIFVVTVAFVGLLVSYPFGVLSIGTVIYLASIPLGVAWYRRMRREDRQAPPEPPSEGSAPPPAPGP
jgi:CDP-diacylglycerol---serine O-phosphatidyltransferase